MQPSLHCRSPDSITGSTELPVRYRDLDIPTGRITRSHLHRSNPGQIWSESSSSDIILHRIVGMRPPSWVLEFLDCSCKQVILRFLQLLSLHTLILPSLLLQIHHWHRLWRSIRHRPALPGRNRASTSKGSPGHRQSRIHCVGSLLHSGLGDSTLPTIHVEIGSAHQCRPQLDPSCHQLFGKGVSHLAEDAG